MTENPDSGDAGPMDTAGGRRHPRRHRRLSRGRQAAGVAVLGLSVVAITATAVAGGLVSTGDVIPAGNVAAPPENRLPVEQTVLATGTSNVGGSWRLTAHKSEKSEGQPAGLPCIRLALTDPPTGTPLLSSGFCGEVIKGFGVGSLPVTNGDEAELLLFGIAPDDATAVEFRKSNGTASRSDTQVGPASFERGRVFVMRTTPTSEEDKVVWLDETGQPGTTGVGRFLSRFRSVQEFKPSE